MPNLVLLVVCCLIQSENRYLTTHGCSQRIPWPGPRTRVNDLRLTYAQKQGIERISLHAQLSARTFYAKLGFQEEGERFEEAGIEHITMTKDLPHSPL